MGDAIEQKMKNKSKRNLKYSNEFTSFLTILGGINSRALDLFRQNLEGRTIQLIRYKLYMKPKLKWPKWSKWSKWSK
jgi:hypothetical protein